MPVLRMPADTSLGDTLGNLGRSLAESMNPLRQIQAQELLAQMRQRQWELQQKQALDAANANAAEVYRRANPHNLSSADLEVAVAQIRNGQYNASQTIEALKAAGGYAAAQAAAGLVDAQHPEWSPAQRSSAKAQILAGKSLSEVEQSYATAANETNKATATIAGTNAAQTPAAKEAAAIGQPETATKLDTQNRLLTEPVISGPLTPETRAQIDQRTIERGVAGVPVTADAPVSSGVAAPLAAERTGATTTGTNLANNATLPRDLTKLQQFPPPGGFDSAAPAQPAPPVMSGRPIPNNPDMVINGYRVTPVPRTSGPMIGAVPGANDAAQKLTETYYKSLNDAYTAGGEPVAKLRDTISQLQNLSGIAQTGGVYGQWTTAMRERAKSLGFGDITTAQQAQTAMDNLLKTLIPELKSDYNLSRVAQPEIALLGKVTGSADLTPPELANILANLRTGTDLSEALRSQASRALGLSSDPTPFDYPDYAKFEGDSFNKYGQVASQNRVDYGAIGARLDNRTPTPTPVQTPPDQPVQAPPDQASPVQQGTGNPVLDFFGSIGHLFGGGGGSAPTPAPPPDSRELKPGVDF